MSDIDVAKFPESSFSPGAVRLERLADASGVELDAIEPVQRHQLTRALESGFRRPIRRVIRRIDEGEALRAALEEMPKRWWFVQGDLEVVVTGFGPFQSHDFNPSKPFAKAVAAGLSGQLASSYEGLTVTFHAAEEFVRLQDYSSQPVLVHCGMAQEREAICLERFAHNVMGSTADNDGKRGDGGGVVPGGPVALETLLPLEELAEQFSRALTNQGRVPVESSRDAGTYVCNALYYRSLLAVRKTRLADRAAEAIFVHIPSLVEDTARECGRIIGREIGDFLVSALHDQSVAALE